MNFRPLIVDCAGSLPFPWDLVLALIVDCAGTLLFLWDSLLALMVRVLNVRGLIVSVVLIFFFQGGLSLLGVG